MASIDKYAANAALTSPPPQPSTSALPAPTSGVQLASPGADSDTSTFETGATPAYAASQTSDPSALGATKQQAFLQHVSDNLPRLEANLSAQGLQGLANKVSALPPSSLRDSVVGQLQSYVQAHPDQQSQFDLSATQRTGGGHGHSHGAGHKHAHGGGAKAATDDTTDELQLEQEQQAQAQQQEQEAETQQPA